MEEKFGPNFNEKTILPKDSVDDYFYMLRQKHRNRLKLASKFSGMYASKKAMNFIFLVCDQLNYNADVRHTAVEIYDLFMHLHVTCLYNYNRSNSKDRARREKSWQHLQDIFHIEADVLLRGFYLKENSNLYNKIASQLFLRVLSCIQIASKIHCTPWRLTPKVVRQYLQGFGHCYGCEFITLSEMRVLRTLEFRLNVTTPLVYVETLLQLLSDDVSLNVNELYKWCTEILDYICLERDSVYVSLLRKSAGMVEVDKYRISWLQNDYMLLSAAVIASASYVLYGFASAEKIVNALHPISKVPSEDIADFCSEIINHVYRRASTIGVEKV